MVEVQVEETSNGCDCDTIWCFLRYAYENDGIIVLALFFLAYVFYKMVWKVWSVAMKSKDAEIDRITNERDFYQSQVFPNLQSSDPNTSVESGDNNE